MGNLQVSVGAGGFNAEGHGLAAWGYPQQPHSACQSNEKGGNGQKICTTFLSSRPSKRAQSLSRSGFRKTQGPLTVEDGSSSRNGVKSQFSTLYSSPGSSAQ